MHKGVARLGSLTRHIGAKTCRFAYKDVTLQTQRQLEENSGTMLYSRHKLDRAGEALIGSDPFLRKEALTIVQTWRDTHLFVMQELNRQVVEFFAASNVHYAFSSMRIKRMTSIEEKLRNNAAKHTKLGGLQDIGGLRFVFSSIEDLDAVKERLGAFSPEHFTFKRSHDYVANPKESGYRSIHYVYQYVSEDERYNGLSVELQVRTRLQHSWAMAVETASLISKTSLKADLDNAQEWRGFFKLVSALFSREEQKPVLKLYDGCTTKQLCDAFSDYKKKKLVDQFKALRVTVNIDLDDDERGYCVLTIDFVKQIVHAKIYPSAGYQEASEMFSEIEAAINEDEAALMVAIDKIREIKEAYPSYFLDTKSFLEYLDEFDKKCALL